MSILRSIGKWFGSFLFTTFLVLAITSVSIIDFTSYENLKVAFGGLFGQSMANVDQQTLDMILVTLRQECVGKESVQLPLREDYSITVVCSRVNEPGANMRDIISTAVFDEMYYKKYDCNFIDCLRSGDFTVVASAYGNQFFRSVQILMVVAAAVGVVLILACEETWPKRLRSIGLNMLFSSIPFFVIEVVLPTLIQNISPETSMLGSGQLNEMMGELFAPMSMYFIYLLVAGIAMTVAGFAWGYLEKRKATAEKVKEKS
jgi:hypothetical protein